LLAESPAKRNMLGLLSPQFVPAVPLADGQRIFCFSFGEGPELDPGGSNRGLAAFLVGRLGASSGGLEIFAQRELAVAVKELGVDVTFTAEPQPGGYITTQQVLEQFRNQSPPAPADERPAVIIAHPHHAWRCLVLTTLAGYVGIVPDPRTSAGLQWQRFGNDDDGYDPESLQAHTRSFETFHPYEIRHQHGICMQIHNSHRFCASPPS